MTARTCRPRGLRLSYARLHSARAPQNLHHSVGRNHQPPRWCVFIAGDCQDLAGLFEGEGTITIASGGRNALPVPRVSMVSTDKSVIDFFHARWPGYLRNLIPYSSSGLAREVFYWQLTANDAVEGFVLDIRPHLQTERVRVKADLILEDIHERVQLRRTTEVEQRRWARMAKMRALNRRGIERPRGEVEGK